ncbi:hypothetical protein NQ318_020224 [Aromia moschata]|uniref:Uncharacterized protein n=1 Tax=Aromia moschata TaxID=1265417 RepID=A0AAV8ZC46_9CUCU|nr:hypothetical protein NQ318_020224 [Aromia moschata]
MFQNKNENKWRPMAISEPLDSSSASKEYASMGAVCRENPSSLRSSARRCHGSSGPDSSSPDWSCPRARRSPPRPPPSSRAPSFSSLTPPALESPSSPSSFTSSSSMMSGVTSMLSTGWASPSSAFPVGRSFSLSSLFSASLSPYLLFPNTLYL